jgi:predicted ferric reductase
LRLDVKALGDYTKSLLKIQPGAIAEIEGAYGKFSYKNYDNTDQIWIAGGIGITPFLSMARSLKPEQKINVDLYYSVKSADELVDYQTLASIMSTESMRFRLIPHIADTSGFLTADIIEKQSGTLKDRDFYICGPPPMMKSMKAQLKTKGVPKYRMHSEEFAMS